MLGEIEAVRLEGFFANWAALEELRRLQEQEWEMRELFLLLSGQPTAASFSDYLENKVLDHVLGKTSFTMPSTVALALTTVVPTDSSTGASITEATYTGYARKAVAGSDLNAAASGSSSNSNALTFAACTSGSSTIIGWALCDSSSTGAGNSLCWGTATSTVISTTQTPATIAVGALVVTLD